MVVVFGAFKGRQVRAGTVASWRPARVVSFPGDGDACRVGCPFPGPHRSVIHCLHFPFTGFEPYGGKQDESPCRRHLVVREDSQAPRYDWSVNEELVVDGERVDRYADGTVKAIGQMRDGQLDGAWRWYRIDGSLMRTGQFDLGVQVGQWQTFDRTGRLVKTTPFKPRPAE